MIKSKYKISDIVLKGEINVQEIRYKYIPMTCEIELTHLISLFYNRFPKNFYFEGEAHDFWELVYIDRGEIIVTAGESQYLLHGGELAFHKPGEFHALKAYNETPADVLIASFVCKSPCMKYFEHRFISLSVQEREYLYEALRNIKIDFIKEYSGSEFGKMQLAKANLEILLIRLIMRDESSKIQKRIESYNKINHANNIADMVNEYLLDNINNRLSLKQIAGALDYSISQMKKLYYSQVGEGIIDTFINMKMDEAQRMLQDGSMNVSQVSSALGYDNPAYFSRLFHSRMDMTPSECARSYRPS